MLDALKKTNYIYLPKFMGQHESDSMVNVFKSWKWRPVPTWLGNFQFSMFSNLRKVPAEAELLFGILSLLVPEQKFNTLFVQKYEVGQQVLPHRDPKNNYGATIIAYFGIWTGGETTIEGEKIQPKHRDVVIQRCNYENLPRPLHEVSPIISGTKYSFILNTII